MNTGEWFELVKDKKFPFFDHACFPVEADPLADMPSANATFPSHRIHVRSELLNRSGWTWLGSWDEYREAVSR